jgi:hypothetical protein
MNLTATTRFRGRNLELFTTDARVSKVDRSESVRIDSNGFSSGGGSKPTQSSEIELHLADGEKVSVSELGSRFPVHAGEHVSAVGAKLGGKNTSFLYFFNHDRRKGTYYRPGWKRLRRHSWRSRLFLLLPLIVLLGLWLSPAQSRASMADWVDQRVVAEESANAHGAGGKSLRDVELETDSASAIARSLGEFAGAGARTARLDQAAGIIRSDALPWVTDGWREGNWFAFGVTAAVLFVLLLMVRRLLTMPGMFVFRRRVKRMMDQHRQAMTAV